MEFVPVLVMAATVKKMVDIARQTADARIRDIIITLTAWVAGVIVTMIAADTPWAAGIDVAGVPLSQVGVAGQILIGIALGSTASLAHDVVSQHATKPDRTHTS